MTPLQILNACQEGTSHTLLPLVLPCLPTNHLSISPGLKMENILARFTTYVAHIIDGNLVTDLLSIDDKTPKTGIDPPPPTIVGGLNNHGTFEGDASMTRSA